jgi:hypothetical protein
LTSRTAAARKSTSDLGSRDDTLKLVPWSDEERLAKERLAERTVARHVEDDTEFVVVLQMLGIKPYAAAKKQRNTTPIKHGTRAGYTNRGCGQGDSPPCPASPSCTDENNRYFRERRAAGKAA